MWRNYFECKADGLHHKLFYEPLKTKAPRAAVKPYCCYLSTVIFYAYPYILTRDKTTYVTYGEVKCQWNLLGKRFMSGEGWSCLSPFVFEGEKVYELVTGWVAWRNGGWQHIWRGREVTSEDWRWKIIEMMLKEAE
jgi:hypothetical protein